MFYGFFFSLRSRLILSFFVIGCIFIFRLFLLCNSNYLAVLFLFSVIAFLVLTLCLALFCYHLNIGTFKKGYQPVDIIPRKNAVIKHPDLITRIRHNKLGYIAVSSYERTLSCSKDLLDTVVGTIRRLKPRQYLTFLNLDQCIDKTVRSGIDRNPELRSSYRHRGVWCINFVRIIFSEL